MRRYFYTAPPARVGRRQPQARPQLPRAGPARGRPTGSDDEGLAEWLDRQTPMRPEPVLDTDREGLLRTLIEHGVQFVPIGGAAIQSYGRRYDTKDVDGLSGDREA